jgi:2-methylcitrate dehydratase PrpD
LLDGLGSTFRGRETALKPYPVHRGAILDLEVSIALRSSHALDPSQIERVDVHYPARFASGYERIGAFAPERAHPRGDVEPHFSSSWAVAVGLVQGRASIDDFTAAGVARLAAQIVPVAQRVHAVADPGLDVDCRGLGAREIVVTLRNGAVLRERIEHAPGGPDHPLSWDALVAKFEDGARRAARPIAVERLRYVIDAVASIESLDDAAAIPPLLG